MSNWADICSIDEILPNMGRCALVDGEQVAIFRVKAIGQDIDDQFYAVNNYCPFSDANIISRGIVGSLSDQIVVASPLYKQHFDLVSGKCLEDETVSLKTYPVRIEGNKIQLAA
ncbi:nitrite reductase small subunit NirD [Thalassotalea sp. PLHSN55]|uniref:nitrite reductase small subunit NirD n=1 Tax=Thalassotalea sp. PLHSN55 TaxID=3435888 RepID=UPI003F828E8C